MTAKVITGDCLETMRAMADNSVDSVVTDPPYGLAAPPPIHEVLTCWLAGEPWKATGKGFMGKEWDSCVPGPEYWKEVFRVLKPGGHAVIFAGSRTIDLMGMAVRLAGFEMRDSLLAYLYGSGFPKSLSVSKAIDKAAGAEREVIRPRTNEPTGGGYSGGLSTSKPALESCEITAPATEAAKQWDGWGTALKPAHEPILLVRKPFSGTVAINVLEHGTGAINVDACRIGTSKSVPASPCKKDSDVYGKGLSVTSGDTSGFDPNTGRWPANVIMDEEAGAILDEQTGEEPSRFFYCAKAGKNEKNAGLESFKVTQTTGGGGLGNPVSGAYGSEKAKAQNPHPTVKPLSLMRWLAKLITPKNGTILDPFNGSGSTGCAAVMEGFSYIGCELSEEYAEVARARIKHWEGVAWEEQNPPQSELFKVES